MAYLKKEQIIDISRRWEFKYGIGKKANLLALRSVIDHVKTSNQKITVKYAEALYELITEVPRSHLVTEDLKAYLALISENDVASIPFPKLERKEIQLLADETIKSEQISSLEYNFNESNDQSDDTDKVINRAVTFGLLFAALFWGGIIIAVIMFIAYANIDHRTQNQKAADELCATMGGCR